MEKQKEVRRISIFGSEGKAIVSQIVEVEGDKISLLPEMASPEKKTDKQEQAKKLPGDLHCGTCEVSFTDRLEQTEHYKLDWHRHNLKRKLKGSHSISQDQFESQSGTGELSSISGSDTNSIGEESEDDEEVGGVSKGAVQRVHGSPLIVFTTPDGVHHAVYKSLLMNTKDSRSTMTLSDLSRSLASLTDSNKPCVILMRSGGHFAGAVFKGPTVVCHKTFHRYTVRAKQGTIQSSRDSNHGAHKPRSAGASLRRYNEAALEQEISELLYSWKQYIDDAVLIMVRSPKNRRIMFGGGVMGSGGKEILISADDPRVRGIPFMTRRPTFSEIKSVWLKLTTIYSGVLVPQQQQTQTPSAPNRTGSKPRDKMAVAEVYMDKVADWLKQSNSDSSTDNEDQRNGEKKQKKKKRKNKSSPISSAIKRNEEVVNPVIKKLHELIINGDEGGVEELLMVNETSPAVDQSGSCRSTINETVNEQYKGSSALHVAASCGHGNIVYMLLSHGANPSIKDDNTNGVPYLVCRDRLTRDQFRRFMAYNPTAFDYSTSLIPGPLTEQMEDSRREKKNQKKKAQKKAQKQKKQAKADAEELTRLEKQRDETLRGLSDREKRALAAEKRMAESTSSSVDTISKYGVCSLCSSSLCGVVHFERLTYRYCSMECVRIHREQLKDEKRI